MEHMILLQKIVFYYMIFLRDLTMASQLLIYFTNLQVLLNTLAHITTLTLVAAEENIEHLFTPKNQSLFPLALKE
jgi:hypothetical protein